ncbi:MAG: DUF4097 family beta strand repeat-containing protein [Acidimicrobiia bacterium]
MIHKTFTVDGTADIEVSIESGRVEVQDGDDGTVDVKADTKLPGFIVEQRGNTILVSSDKNTSWLSRGSASIVIEAPQGSDLRVAVASANVYVGVDVGKAEIKTASGDISMESAESLVVKTASGDLQAESVKRSVRAASASGDVRIEKVGDGNLSVSTASGDVHVEECGASIDLNTASGDVYIARFEGRSANFKSMSGSVDLGIPSGSTVDLDVNTLSGKVRLPDSEARGAAPVRHISIRAKLVSGDFSIERV